MNNVRWADFYQATKDSPHWPLLERAAALAGGAGHALDLGCGAGRDTRFLLANGWSVTAVDREPAAIALLGNLQQERLRAVCSSFEDFDYPPASYNLVSAQYALPFLAPPAFAGVFARIERSLAPGGVFAGQFFGPRDEWNKPENSMTFLAREQVEALLAGLTVHELMEEDRPGTTASGASKHWHVFHVLAQRAR
jgi:tellurite methyltransferase